MAHTQTLVLTPATLSAIGALTQRAHSQPYPPHHARKLFRRPLPDRSLVVPHGYRCSLTVGQFRPGWTCRHLTVSLPNQWPKIADVRKLMALFGFYATLEQCFTWADGRTVNALEPLDGDWSPMWND